MRRRLWDFLGKWLSRRGNANTMFALADKCHGRQRKGGPVMVRTAVSLFIRKFTSGDLTSRHVYRMLREFVDFTATLRYEPCTQFINVSQRALHIYFIDGCRRIKSKTKTATCEQAPRSLFLFWLCMARNFQFIDRTPLGNPASPTYSSSWHPTQWWRSCIPWRRQLWGRWWDRGVRGW